MTKVDEILEKLAWLGGASTALRNDMVVLTKHALRDHLLKKVPRRYQKGAVLFYSPNEDKSLGFTDGFNSALTEITEIIKKEL